MTCADIAEQKIWSRTKSPGSSVESQRLNSFIARTFHDLRAAVSWNRPGDAIALLNEVYDECSEPDWNGYGASPVSAAAYEEAVTFLNALPASVPIPEVVPEPDGSVGFEWWNGRHRIFTVMTAGNGSLVYAGIIGRGNKAHGIEAFDDSIPENLLAYINRIF